MQKQLATVTRHTLPDVPTAVAVCPICGAGLVIEEIDEWYEDGSLPDGALKLDCSTAPDDDRDRCGWL